MEREKSEILSGLAEGGPEQGVRRRGGPAEGGGSRGNNTNTHNTQHKHSHKHTQTQPQTHTNTHKHTHTPAVSLKLSLLFESRSHGGSHLCSAQPQAYCGWQACSAEASRGPRGDAAHGVFPRSPQESWWSVDDARSGAQALKELEAPAPVSRSDAAERAPASSTDAAECVM